ncbi:MAG: carbonic anhydrase, partial [Bacteroidia bacterium]
MNAEQIIIRLKEGNERYVSDQLGHDLQDHNRRNELTKGQQPHTIVLSCAD